MASIPRVTFSDGNSIPQIGLGVFKVPPEETQAVVAAALEVGYRLIDTAAVYGNEEAVGKAIADSGLDRDELFITTKLRTADQGYESALRAFEASIDRLGLDRLDLYLIHWPAPDRDLYVESWRAFEKLKEEGRVGSIGVSNFRISDLERLMRECQEVPVINQIELHPLLVQDELRDFHARHDIVTEAWSPLAKAVVLGDPILAEIAAEIGKTTSQVVLRWHLQLGNVAIPKTVTPGRIKENLELFDFTLTPEQMATISALDEGVRTGPDPDTYHS